jgi:hypothetical protein
LGGIRNLKDDKVDEFLDYFNNVYLNFNKDGTISKDTIYNIENWTCAERIIYGYPRTSNTVEAWNRSLNQRCVVAHPNIACLVGVLKDFEEENRIEISQNCKLFNTTTSVNLKKNLCYLLF